MPNTFPWPRLAVMAFVALAGCSTDAAFSPPIDTEQLYWMLRTDHHAVQLTLSAPNDSIQLSTTAFTPAGAVWTPGDDAAMPAVSWFSTDSSKVTVSPTGVVRARAVTSGIVRVIAGLRVNNVTHADTVQVRVVAEPTSKVFTTFEVRPTDSVKVAQGAARAITIRALDQNNATMNGMVCYFTTSDTTIAKFSSPWSSGAAATSATIQTRKRGTVLVTATAWAYGVVKTDTFTLKVGYPINVYPTVSFRLLSNGDREFYIASDSVDIGPGGDVGFTNRSGNNVLLGQAIDITFSDPSVALAAAPPNAASGAGNIIGIPSDLPGSVEQLRRHRRFLAAGTYTYTVQPYNLTGKIIVHDE